MNVKEVIPLLLEACPSARPAWDDHVSWWNGEPAGSYNDVAVFAHHIVESYGAGRVEEMPAFFEALERLIVEGSEDVFGLATVGLIEGLQNVASHQEFGYVVFEQWLGAESRGRWSEIEAMWDGVGSLADMIRKERS